MYVKDLLKLFSAGKDGNNPMVREGEDKYLMVAFIPNRRESPASDEHIDEPIGYDLVGPLSDEDAGKAALIAANVVDAISVKLNKRLINCSAHMIKCSFTEQALGLLHINASLENWRTQMEERSNQMDGK